MEIAFRKLKFFRAQCWVQQNPNSVKQVCFPGIVTANNQGRFIEMYNRIHKVAESFDLN